MEREFQSASSWVRLLISFLYSIFGDVSDDSAAFSFPPINEPTIVDLCTYYNDVPPVWADIDRFLRNVVEKRNISWASYAENLPYVGYGGVDYSSHNCGSSVSSLNRLGSSSMDLRLTLMIPRRHPRSC